MEKILWTSDSATVTIAEPAPEITLAKTVGTDPDLCATTDVVTITAGSQVTYCYEVENTGDTTLTTHDLVDSHLGTILTGFPYILAPGASAFLTESTNVSDTTVNTATWTATNGSVTASATDTATVVAVPLDAEIALAKTVGTDPDACATDTEITVSAGSEVVYCYEVTNTGDVAFNNHDLEDSELGTILEDFAFLLLPGESTFVTEAATIDDTTLNTATWTATALRSRAEGAPAISASASADATVNVEDPGVLPDDDEPPDPTPGGVLARTGSDAGGLLLAGLVLAGLGLVLWAPTAARIRRRA